ncbi:hypothetical protein [Neorhizobium sp. JUb45]|uniref:hypothetical protein n=1 Tax=unclassified Neorhizobium TaxID=2629175 RepID=UPI00104FCF7C|nr:hypothetical protein [Neorhizobium sp. JUb45]TCR04049.1 hypothetical protein EDF70_102145 [Neorhizobium sp. JUb45]
MKISNFFTFVFLNFCFAFSVSAQTSTPMPESVERRLPQACAVDVVNLIDAICHNKGTVNTVAINFPGVCKQYNITSEITKKLSECKGDNVFFEMWKFKFDISNDFKEKFVDYVEEIRLNEKQSDSDVSLTSASEAFRLLVWACGLDAKCHRSVFDSLSAEAKNAFQRTPYFCDYAPEITSFDDSSYRTLFFQAEYPDGIAQPMCRAYYCKYKVCSEKETSDGVFILSDVFRVQYDLLYKAIQP